MQVILLQDVAYTGKKGDLITVADGYGRNFLLKKGLAQIANSVNKNVVTQAKQSQNFHKQEERKAYAEQSKKLQGRTITIPVKVGENGKLFGAITSQEIADRLSQAGVTIDKKKLEVPLIKLVGSYVVKAKFCEGINAKFTVMVENTK